MSDSFEKDLSRGKEVEQMVLDIIRKRYPCTTLIEGKFKPFDLYVPERDMKVEIKADWKSNETGNIIIELFMFGQPSGLFSTEADFWVIYTGKEFLWAKPRSILMCIVLNRIQAREILGEGDTEKKMACLIPIEVLRVYCEKI
tara:strand:- start:1378 stop:1806 length:429 start_codon:yes stop_codon:yes gene_type:complete